MTIFKYQTIDTCFWANFKNNVLWFDTPKNFDDDFDSDLPIDTEYTREEIEGFIRKSYQMNFNTDLEFEKVFNETIEKLSQNKNVRKEFFQCLINEHIEKRIGISCFSKSSKVRVLWGKYADKSMGVCFEFDTTFDSDFFKNSYEVKYVPTLPKVKFELNNSLPNTLNTFCTTKHLDWAEQKEIRLFRHKKGAYKYNPISLRKIYFGSKCAKKDIEKIISMGLIFNPKLEFYERKKNEGDYEFIKL